MRCPYCSSIVWYESSSFPGDIPSWRCLNGHREWNYPSMKMTMSPEEWKHEARIERWAYKEVI